MSNINLEKHYAAFKWAVSTNWKDKNGLYGSIQYKIHVLKNEYGLSEEEIVDELFEEYWERGHYRKYDETKGSLNNWIARHISLYLKVAFFKNSNGSVVFLIRTEKIGRVE